MGQLFVCHLEFTATNLRALLGCSQAVCFSTLPALFLLTEHERDFLEHGFDGDVAPFPAYEKVALHPAGQLPSYPRANTQPKLINAIIASFVHSPNSAPQTVAGHIDGLTLCATRVDS